jgi:RNA polymerase sigma factor (sigma-70 family)
MINNKDKAESNQEDVQAINRVLAGDKSAFAILQKKYQRLINSLIRKMIRNESDIEDLVQETFIKVYSALETYQQSYAFSSWIYRIASNNCIDYMRKKRFQYISINQPIDGDEDLTFEIEDNTYKPDINVMSKEKTQIIQKAIKSLPENYQVVIKLRHIEELEYNEIAEKLNLPLGTVKAHLFRARKILLDELKGKKNILLNT